MVSIGERTEPAWMWAHYKATTDQVDRQGRHYGSKAERVMNELWDFYRCEEGHLEKAKEVSDARCQKLVLDMHYEAQVQCIINYYADRLRRKISKTEARTVRLTREQYLEMPTWWCRNNSTCWSAIVEKWFTPEWQAKHDAGRERRLMMPGPAHHQGCLTNKEYRTRWDAHSFIYSNAHLCLIYSITISNQCFNCCFSQSDKHGGVECNEFKGWVLARKGKVSEATYNPDDPPSAYSNPSVHTRISTYTETGRQAHGPEWDPSTHPLDGEVIMRAGQGKKHGRFYIGDGILVPTDVPSLSQIRAASTTSSPAILTRPSATQVQVQQLQARLDAQEAAYQATLAQVDQRVDQRVEQQVAQVSQHMAQQMYTWLQAVQSGQPLPPLPMVFPPPPPPPPATPANQSAASNTPEMSPGISPTLIPQLLFPSTGGPSPTGGPPPQ